jgi:hypothetical protein
MAQDLFYSLMIDRVFFEHSGVFRWLFVQKQPNLSDLFWILLIAAVLQAS